MTKTYSLFRQGLVIQSVAGGRWESASHLEEEEACDILNGYKEVDPSIKHMRRLETLPEPSGKHLTTLVPLSGVVLLGICAISAGLPWFPVTAACMAAGAFLGRLEAVGNAA